MFDPKLRHTIYPVTDGGFVIERETDNEIIMDAVAKTPEEIAAYFSNPAKTSIDIINDAHEKHKRMTENRDFFMALLYNISRRRNIEAIKLVREKYKTDLKEAKFFVDEIRNHMESGIKPAEYE